MQKKFDFKFIDLFAGIGGFHIAMHNIGGECVFASEMDSHARKTYELNFKNISPELFENKLFNDDIRNISPDDIPDFDVLCAGFPCQPFSQAGHKRGFDDNHSSERGNLFFSIAEILEDKKPKAFFLENVRGLVKHDNGNTFKIIRNILEELGYSFYYKIIKATDYGLPQHRPRVFMIGFRDENLFRNFTFPNPIPLKFNMSDVWGGICSREIGFTIRVGGRGSNINDRRNWDSYLVDGLVKRLSHIEGKKMQGFPDNFEFPVTNTQAIKQLGNSVAIDAIQAVGHQMLNYMDFTSYNKSIDENKPMEMKNKGEWTELLVFIKLLVDKKLDLADMNMNPNGKELKIHKVSTLNLDLEFEILDGNLIKVINPVLKTDAVIDLSDFVDDEKVTELRNKIINAKGRSFSIPEFQLIQDNLGFHVVKGGNSSQKADVLLDISNNEFESQNEGFGIKSYLGSQPTLLNPSGNTNFLFEIIGLDKKHMDEINSIDIGHKLKKRIQMINLLGGKFKFKGAEKKVMDYNLKMVDSLMPDIVGFILLHFYRDRISSLSDIVNTMHDKGELNDLISYGDKKALINKVQKLLIDILLGLFPGTKWDGNWVSNGTIVLKSTGDCIGYHVIDTKTLKEYLYKHIRLDTPSTTRYRYGKIFIEKDGKMYFKLNLQLRF
jgi:DNA (cytosine-5)-methyltransferase 1